LSNLANSCEYISNEKICNAALESEKAKANRQLRCLNDEKLCCCYICGSRSECTISCKYLGATDNTSAPHAEEAPKPAAEMNHTVENTKKIEANPTSGVPVTYCSACNVEMSPKRTRLRIDGDNTQPKQFGDYSSQTEEHLAVLVYLCPCCGRIEFKADTGIKN
jgi:hypothetical protein